MGPIVDSIKLRADPNFRAMQIDYAAMQNLPPELLANPDFDPLFLKFPMRLDTNKRTDFRRVWV